MTLFADRALAVRVEALAARGTREFAEASGTLYPGVGAAWLEVGGGIAGYNGSDSAVNGTVGVGLSVPATEVDIAAIEEFFVERGARPVVSACPLADRALSRWLAARGWVICGYENVLARRLVTDERLAPSAEGIEIVLAHTDEQLLDWATLVVEGFSAPEAPTIAETRLGRTAIAAPDRLFLTAYVDGVPAGTGELQIADGIGWLSADTTLPAFRGRGVQGSLQRARLEMARASGCDLAVTEATPGSPSQRNMERAGFRLVYTRTEMALGKDSRTDADIF